MVDDGSQWEATQPTLGEHTIAFDTTPCFKTHDMGQIAVLVCMNGHNRGWCFILGGPQSIVGTDADCDVVVYDPTLARRHASIRYRDDQWTIADLDTSAGTFFMGSRLTEQQALVSGDKVRMGRTLFRFFCTELS